MCYVGHKLAGYIFLYFTHAGISAKQKHSVTGLAGYGVAKLHFDNHEVCTISGECRRKLRSQASRRTIHTHIPHLRRRQESASSPLYSAVYARGYMHVGT